MNLKFKNTVISFDPSLDDRSLDEVEGRLVEAFMYGLVKIGYIRIENTEAEEKDICDFLLSNSKNEAFQYEIELDCNLTIKPSGKLTISVEIVEEKETE